MPKDKCDECDGFGGISASEIRSTPTYVMCPVCGGTGERPKDPQQLISEGKDRLAGLRARMDQVRAGRDRS